jgi:hypothetical protein
MEATVGFMDASIDPQRFDVRGEAVIEIRAKTWPLRFIKISADFKISFGLGQKAVFSFQPIPKTLLSSFPIHEFRPPLLYGRESGRQHIPVPFRWHDVRWLPREVFPKTFH